MKAMILLLTVVFGLTALAGCPSNGGHGGAPLKSDPRHVAMGKQLYAAYCAACHGATATGGVVGPDLQASRFKYGKNKTAISQSILKGRPGGMPAFEAHLKPDEVTYLAEYLLQLH